MQNTEHGNKKSIRLNAKTVDKMIEGDGHFHSTEVEATASNIGLVTEHTIDILKEEKALAEELQMNRDTELWLNAEHINSIFGGSVYKHSTIVREIPTAMHKEPYKGKKKAEIILSAESENISSCPSSLNFQEKVNNIALGDIYITKNKTVFQPGEKKNQFNIAALRETLAEHYKDDNKIPYPFVNPQDKSPPFLLDETFVALQLIEEKARDKSAFEQREAQEKALALRTGRLSSYEDIYNSASRKKLELRDLFQKKDTSSATTIKFCKRILVNGRAGIGKSTLLKYMAYLYSQQTTSSLKVETPLGDYPWLKQFDVLLHVPLRHLNRYPLKIQDSLPLQLADFIGYCLSLCGKEAAIQAIQQLLFDPANVTIEEKSLSVCLLLDGLDEARSLLGEGPGKAIIQNKRRLLNALLALSKEPHVYTVLSTRPMVLALADSLYSEKDPECQIAEVMGFDNVSIEAYVRQYFKEGSQDNRVNNPKKPMTVEGEELWKIMTQQPTVWGIAHIPVVLSLLCQLWQMMPETMKKQRITHQSEITLSLTDIYQELVTKLRWWLTDKRNQGALVYLEKAETVEKESIISSEHIFLRFLEQLALSAMVSGEILLTPPFLRHALTAVGAQGQSERSHFLKVLQESGFLCFDEWKIEGEDYLPVEVHFFHLSIQEFFAACAIKRSIMDSLMGAPSQLMISYYHLENLKTTTKPVPEFIGQYKYLPSFEIVWPFVTGLLVQLVTQEKAERQQEALRFFWNTLQAEPRDLNFYGDITLWLRCLEESSGGLELIPLQEEMMEWLHSLFKSYFIHPIRDDLPVSYRVPAVLMGTFKGCPQLMRLFLEKEINAHLSSEIRKNLLDSVRELNVCSMAIVKWLQHNALHEERGTPFCLVLFQFNRKINNMSLMKKLLLDCVEKEKNGSKVNTLIQVFFAIAGAKYVSDVQEEISQTLLGIIQKKQVLSNKLGLANAFFLVTQPAEFESTIKAVEVLLTCMKETFSFSRFDLATLKELMNNHSLTLLEGEDELPLLQEIYGIILDHIMRESYLSEQEFEDWLRMILLTNRTNQNMRIKMYSAVQSWLQKEDSKYQFDILNLLFKSEADPHLMERNKKTAFAILINRLETEEWMIDAVRNLEIFVESGWGISYNEKAYSIILYRLESDLQKQKMDVDWDYVAIALLKRLSPERSFWEKVYQLLLTRLQQDIDTQQLCRIGGNLFDAITVEEQINYNDIVSHLFKRFTSEKKVIARCQLANTLGKIVFATDKYKEYLLILKKYALVTVNKEESNVEMLMHLSNALVNILPPEDDEDRRWATERIFNVVRKAEFDSEDIADLLRTSLKIIHNDKKYYLTARPMLLNAIKKKASYKSILLLLELDKKNGKENFSEILVYIAEYLASPLGSNAFLEKVLSYISVQEVRDLCSNIMNIYCRRWKLASEDEKEKLLSSFSELAISFEYIKNYFTVHFGQSGISLLRKHMRSMGEEQYYSFWQNAEEVHFIEDGQIKQFQIAFDFSSVDFFPPQDDVALLRLIATADDTLWPNLYKGFHLCHRGALSRIFSLETYSFLCDREHEKKNISLFIELYEVISQQKSQYFKTLKDKLGLNCYRMAGYYHVASYFVSQEVAKERLAQAEKLFKKAINNKNYSSVIYVEYGHFLYRQKRFKEALEQLEIGSKKNEREGVVYSKWNKIICEEGIRKLVEESESHDIVLQFKELIYYLQVLCHVNLKKQDSEHALNAAFNSLQQKCFNSQLIKLAEASISTSNREKPLKNEDDNKYNSELEPSLEFSINRELNEFLGRKIQQLLAVFSKKNTDYLRDWQASFIMKSKACWKKELYSLERLINTLADKKISWDENAFLTKMQEILESIKEDPEGIFAFNEPRFPFREKSEIRELIDKFKDEANLLDKKLNPTKYDKSCCMM